LSSSIFCSSSSSRSRSFIGNDRVAAFVVLGDDLNGSSNSTSRSRSFIGNDRVAAEHARKTVTMEPHPHLSSLASSSSPKVASIHPCKHAAVMKKLVSMGAGGGEASATTKEGGGGEEAKTKTAELDPESYLVLFLKFISSVIPTIEYDFTMHASVGR
jgi:hypothetical protein